jgi:hypothetical protein
MARVGRPADLKPRDSATRVVTRRRPKIDRIACPWLIARFVDADAGFHDVPPDGALQATRELDAVPCDVPGVPFSHVEGQCSFDAFVRDYRLRDPALAELARMARRGSAGHRQWPRQPR